MNAYNFAVMFVWMAFASIVFGLTFVKPTFERKRIKRVVLELTSDGEKAKGGALSVTTDTANAIGAISQVEQGQLSETKTERY